MSVEGRSPEKLRSADFAALFGSIRNWRGRWRECHDSPKFTGNIMSYSAPLQLHVIWHPSSDNFCRPHAEQIYTALNRDPYQPLVPGIGIPVFYRCVGQDPRRPLDAPAAIQVPSTSHDLRIVLLTPDFVLDEKWEAYLACCAEEIADKRGRAALVTLP